MTRLAQALYPLEPQARQRVWGGQRLMPHDPPIGEVWSAFDGSRVQAGAYAGQTVAELASAHGAAFLGTDVATRFPSRFPLLVKLLDCADWLSVQVHPDDEHARRMVGAGALGKTEAWHFLEVEEGATILAGATPGTTAEMLVDAIRAGTVLDVSQSHAVRAGETYLLRAGTLHALGPGLLVYEVQQASDTTYRVYDWDRPACHGRELHPEESVAVVDVHKTVVPIPPPVNGHASVIDGMTCPFFTLDLFRLAGSLFTGDTEGQTCHVLTVASGEVALSCGAETLRLKRHETAIVAGAAGLYQAQAMNGSAQLLRATIPQAARTPRH